jgi:aminoglycoside phosphotransferase (APT) family kinase protein
MFTTAAPLSQTWVVRYLLEKRLIDPEDICGSALVTSDASRRNSNIKVIRELGVSYLVKRCVERNAVETLANEARIYAVLHGDRRFRAVSSYIPRFYGFDSRENVLVLELIGDRKAEDLEHYHLRGYFSKAIARMQGRGLAELHRAFPRDLFDQLGLAEPTYRLPWIFSLHRPSIGQARDLSSASSQVIGIIQRHRDFHVMIDKCADYWEPTTLVHGDIKWANFVLFSPAGTGRRTRLKIIDWEYAGLGDPCWDVGSVFSAYLSCWILSMAMIYEGKKEGEDICRFPLPLMQPALRVFWSEYSSRLKLDDIQREKYLWRATLFSAVRSIQTAIEQTQRTNVLSKNIIHLVQLAMNTLAYPVETIVHVFGIDLRADGA